MPLLTLSSSRGTSECTQVLCSVLLCCVVVCCSVVWCGVVWCGVVWCGVVWCGVVWCGVVWCGVVWCGALEFEWAEHWVVGGVEVVYDSCSCWTRMLHRLTHAGERPYECDICGMKFTQSNSLKSHRLIHSGGLLPLLLLLLLLLLHFLPLLLLLHCCCCRYFE